MNDRLQRRLLYFKGRGKGEGVRKKTTLRNWTNVTTRPSSSDWVTGLCSNRQELTSSSWLSVKYTRSSNSSRSPPASRLSLLAKTIRQMDANQWRHAVLLTMPEFLWTSTMVIDRSGDKLERGFLTALLYNITYTEGKVWWFASASRKVNVRTNIHIFRMWMSRGIWTRSSYPLLFPKWGSLVLSLFVCTTMHLAIWQTLLSRELETKKS